MRLRKYRRIPEKEKSTRNHCILSLHLSRLTLRAG